MTQTRNILYQCTTYTNKYYLCARAFGDLCNNFQIRLSQEVKVCLQHIPSMDPQRNSTDGIR